MTRDYRLVITMLPCRRSVELGWGRVSYLEWEHPAARSTVVLLRDSINALIVNPEQRTPELYAEIAAGALPQVCHMFAEFQRSEFTWRGLRTDLSGRLAELTMPVLFVHGADDPAVPLRYAQAAARRTPDATLVAVPDAGHWVQRDQPTLVGAAVVDFLHRTLPRAER